MLMAGDLRLIGKSVERDIRDHLDARWPDDRRLGAWERRQLLELMEEVHRLRGVCYKLTREDDLDDVERKLIEAVSFRLGGAFRAIRAKLVANDAAMRRFHDLNPNRERRRAPIDHLTGWRIAERDQFRAKSAICQAVRGAGEIGPRWRVGSNNPWGPEESSYDNSTGRCPYCGAPSDDFKSFDGREYCPACGEAWVVGDYDWQSLRDCLAYREDREAGRVLNDEPNGWRGHIHAILGRQT